MNQSIEISSEYRCLLSKLEELLRYYRIAKKNDKNNALQERVKSKSNEIIAKLQTFPVFDEIERQCRNKVELTFREVPVASSKVGKDVIGPVKAKQPELPRRNIGSSSASSYSSYSSQSSFSNNDSMASKIKKQMPVIQQKPKIPVMVERPRVETPSPIQTPSPISTPSPVSTPKPPPVPTPPPAPKVIVKQEIKKEPQQIKVEVITPQPEAINESMNRSSQSLNEMNQNPNKKENSSISSIQNLKFNEKDNKSQGSHGSLLGLLDDSQSKTDYCFQLQKVSSEEKVETPPSSINFQNQREEDSQKLSEASQSQNTIDTIVKFCCDNKDNLNAELLFNEDIFDYIREEEGEFIYLFGVNKPEGKKMQKLYACTLMKFSIPEVFKCDDLFEKETKDFKNNIRTPIGLIIKGNNANAIQPEHLKFLINLQCPYMTILVLKDYQQYDGVLCHFHESALGRIRITPRKQLGQCAEELIKKTYSLPFNESFLPKEKTRFVITKYLNRTIATIAEEAPNAITIADNQCIRQQKNSFNYKLHSKFLVSTKPQYSLYYVNNGVVNARMGFKDFQQFKKEALALQPKVPAIFSLNLTRDNIPIKKQFFELLLQCTKVRDPNIFLNLSNISVKKTIVVALKSDVTMEMLEATEPIQYKNFEKDTALTFCLLAIGKNNAKEFEADGKNELMEIKPK